LPSIVLRVYILFIGEYFFIPSLQSAANAISARDTKSIGFMDGHHSYEEEERQQMAMPLEGYRHVIVESFERRGSGLHGEIHIRPIEGQGYPADIMVECPMVMRTGFPVGTRFRIKAKLTDRLGRGRFLWSHHSWKFHVFGPHETLS
jgi:hypothetical protein